MVDYSSNILVVEVDSSKICLPNKILLLKSESAFISQKLLDSLILLREVGFTGSFEGAFVSASGEQFLD